MNIRHFVSGSSILLAGWLGLTFVHEVPAQRYPKLEKAKTAAASDEKNQNSLLATATANTAEIPVVTPR